jgi:hypothetical protein
MSQVEVCNNCDYKQIENSRDSHSWCYMFKEIVYGCAQFKPVGCNQHQFEYENTECQWCQAKITILMGSERCCPRCRIN